MEIAIIDDEELSISILQNEVEKYFPGNYIRKISNNYNELLKYTIDICFIDVLLGKTNGIDLAIKYTEIYPRCKIVIISHQDGQVYNSLKAKLFFFIRKDKLEKDMRNFYNKYARTINVESKQVEVIHHREKLLLKVHDIIYMVTTRNICFIHTVDNNCYEVYNSMAQLLRLIDSASFYRINQQEVINILYLRRVVGRKIVMENDMELIVSKRNVKDFSLRRQAYLLRNT